MISFQNDAIAKKFRSYPPDVRDRLLFFRQLIFDVAADHPEIGDIIETLKWGEPSFSNPKTGSAIRMDWKQASSELLALYFNCKTTLLDDFKLIYPSAFCYQGNRAIHFDRQNHNIDIAALKHCFYLSLTYKLRKTPFCANIRQEKFLKKLV